MSTQESLYHHGNLRQALLDSSLAILRSEGIEALSLRRLAEHTGVSRGAPYHHFRDKQALLAAVAEQGFAELDAILGQVVEATELAKEQRLRLGIEGYLGFALREPALYGLMFGGPLWSLRAGEEKHLQRFQRRAKDCFRHYVRLFEQQAPATEPQPGLWALRHAQLTWASLHGLAHLARDGGFFRAEELVEIALAGLAHTP